MPYQHREASCDVNTAQATSQLEVIRTIYGGKLANELLEFSLEKGSESSATASSMNLFHRVRGYISNANYKYAPNVVAFSLFFCCCSRCVCGL